MKDVVVRRLDAPEDARHFDQGRFETVDVGGMTIGRATYRPGWKWSRDVGVALGQKSCQIEHVCMVVSGHAAIAMDDGAVTEVGPGDIFYCPPGHDSWVVGDEPYVSLHFMGAEG